MDVAAYFVISPVMRLLATVAYLRRLPAWASSTPLKGARTTRLRRLLQRRSSAPLEFARASPPLGLTSFANQHLRADAQASIAFRPAFVTPRTPLSWDGTGE